MEGERPKDEWDPGVRLGFHSSDSSRGWGVSFTRGRVGLTPKGGLSHHLKGEQHAASNNKTKKHSEKKTQKHTPKMLLIGRLGGSCTLG